MTITDVGWSARDLFARRFYQRTRRPKKRSSAKTRLHPGRLVRQTGRSGVRPPAGRPTDRPPKGQLV